MGQLLQMQAPLEISTRLNPILFVHTDFTNSNAGAIRTRNFIKHISKTTECHILVVDERIELTGGLIHAVNGSLFPDFFQAMFPWVDRAIFSLIRRAFALWLGDYPNHSFYHRLIYSILRRIQQLDALHHYSAFVLMVPPWNIYPLLSFRWLARRAIVDIGDPMYGNSTSSDRAEVEKSKFEFEHRHISRSAGIAVTNRATEKFYIENYGLPPSNVTVVGAGVDTDLFRPLGPKPPNDGNRPIKLVYAGALYRGLREPNELFQALISLSAEQVFDFKIFGGYIFDEAARDELAKTLPSFAKTYPLVPQEELIGVYAEADILIYIDNAFGIQTPSKVYELACLCRPCLFLYDNERSETLALARNFPNFIICRNASNDIVSQLNSLRQAPPTVAFMPDFENYSWERFAMELVSFIRERTKQK